ncbi:uncharacterized protein TNCV_2320231 [Trichonephila clavipes]|nr:uncharacterized protein TNCV_2320231 [Trichonephila clavipes]
MITNFFISELSNHDVQELWFQQDGATCHTARATIDLLKDTFGDRLISRFGPVNWPPRSCDLTPLDYFLWGYVTSLAYANKPQTLDHLEDNIRRVIADIRPQMLEKVIENWTSRLDYIRASHGSPMPEIILKIAIPLKKTPFIITDIDVTFDSTWLTRGHSSQIGVGFVIDLLTEFVMDFEIMSKRCIECEHAKSGLGENSAEFHVCDDAHFWLNGYVNKQNCRIWSEANPQVYVETPLHPEKLNVWCALWAGGILLQKR